VRWPAALAVILFLPWTVFAEGQEPAAEPSSADLVTQTLREDIETASYYELLAWCRELGLEDAGTRQALVDRLRVHYGVEPAAGKAEEAPRRVLTITSARSTEYFKVQEIDENYILLTGDVVVELKEGDAIHRIRAQKILLNQTANLLTAEGDIDYTFQKGERQDRFHGQKITFDVESWEGVFFSGGMEGDRDVGGKKVHFYFNADSIAKLERNTVVMERGTITSCNEAPDPHYHLKARKIWVLAPGEWAIANAVLYIGRIPVLWLPFFFRPGDEFFFHPAIGTRTREGSFLQTTTYLIGQKKRSPSAISVLAATEEAGQQYQREIKGLFLRQKEGAQVPVKEERFLKVLLDYYSRLGGFAGVSGDFPPKVSFRAGLGFSRNIYTNGVVYTPWTDEGGVFHSVWNKSWLFGAEAPFRYGTDSKWDLSGGGYRLSGKFEYFSDPFFNSDFYNRAEETGLNKLLGLEPTPVPTQTVEAEKLGLSWEIVGQAEFPKLATEPYLKKISVPYLSGNLVWQSKTNEALPPVDPADPARLFYYPVSLKLPNAALQLSGDLISIAAQPKAQKPVSPPAAPAQPSLPAELRLPALLGRETPASPAEPPPPSTEPAMRVPLPRENLAIPAPPLPASFLLSYQVRPTMAVEQSFNTAAWTDPSQVRYDLNYTSLESTGTSSLDWALKVYEQLFALSGSFSAAGNYRTRFRRSFADDTQWSALVTGDRRYSQILVRNLFNASFSPFASDPHFRATSISYSLNWTAFRYMYDESSANYNGIGPGWNPQTFSQNLLQATLGWQPGSRLNALTLTAQLPPLLASINAKAEFYVWLLKTTVNTVFTENVDSWPLTVQEALEITPDVRLSQEVQTNLNQGSVQKTISSLNLWGLSSTFTAQAISGEIRPTYVTVGYRLAQKDLYFWRNRQHFQVTINSNWSMNLQNVTENNLTFSFNMKYFIYKFLEFSFTSLSYNNLTYLYFPSLAGGNWVNPLTDLLDSFNFFDINARMRSRFKLKSLAFEIIHHMHDWDLSLRYEGKPALVTDTTTGKLKYTWNNSFTILLQWIPIPEMRSTMRNDPTTDRFYIRG
jgi:hypothetical protein